MMTTPAHDTMTPKRLCLLLLPALLALALFLLPVAGAHAQMPSGIVVDINKSTLIRLPVNASVVAVADPEIADVDVLAPNLVSIKGRGVGQTSVMAFDGNGNEILNDTVTVNHNIRAIQSIIHRVMPDAEIRFDSIEGALVASGTVASPLEADNLRKLVEPFLGDDSFVNMLDITGSDQVLLKVRVAEVSRSELKRFGINLYSLVSQGGEFAFGLVSGRDILPNAAGVIPRAGNNNIAIDYSRGDFDLNSVIDALADDNLIKVLAEPNLTTASGRTANFLAGGEFPIPVPGQDGQVTIEYREYGVALQFTPQVLSKEKISLTVAPEVSELTQIGAVEVQGFNIPALTTRRAETTVELGSGQSFAIAGLLQNSNSNNVSKFPGLGDIPILGALFRSSEFQNNQSELVIIVTPYIVRGVAESQLADPTQGYVTPTDPDRILKGHTYTPDAEKAREKEAEHRQDYLLEGSPADMRRPKFRRSIAEQAAGKVERREETMIPAPPVAKTTPADKASVQPVTAEDVPPPPRVAPAPAPAPATDAPRPSPRDARQPPASLNGPVGYMLQ